MPPQDQSTAVMATYGRFPVKVERGQGVWVHDSEGRRYLDCVAGIATCTLGHSDRALRRALTQQLRKLQHVSNLYAIGEQEQLASWIAGNSCCDQVFFCNSGTEAVECGLKAIRRYIYAKGQPQKNRIVSLSGAFHGRSLAAIATAANPVHCEGFLVGDMGFDQAEFGNVESLVSVVNENTAGIILEPVQGEGGIRPAEPEYLRAVRDLCDSHDILLMFDEVQCGVARTGSLFAYQQLGVSPDILASAKGLGGGFPIGACLATEAVAAALVAGSHGSTFGGNPLATAVSNALIDTVSDADFLNSVNSLGNYLKEELQKLVGRYPQLLSEVKGLGLMLGLYCLSDAGELITRLQEQKLLLVKAGGNCVRLLPALNVTKEEIDSALDTINMTLSEM